MKQNLSNLLNEGLNDNDVSYQSVNNFLLLPKGTNANKNCQIKFPMKVEVFQNCLKLYQQAWPLAVALLAPRRSGFKSNHKQS